MEIPEILDTLRRAYDPDVQTVTLFRDSGNRTYRAQGKRLSYFVKTVRPPYLETAMDAVAVQLYLQQRRFPVIPLLRTREGAPYVRLGSGGNELLLLLYPFLAGGEPGPEDLEAVGALTARLHNVMESYPGRLLTRGKDFFIDRYVRIMRDLRYEKTEAFRVMGDALWERVKHLPGGFCHCDLYDGNIHKTNEGTLYVVDFDTSCRAFPMYDVVLFCNRTHYFRFEPAGYAKTRRRLRAFLQGYQRHRTPTAAEMDAFDALLAVYHFQLQATVLQARGYDATVTRLFDSQYDWLLRWQQQCAQMGKR